MIKDRFNRYINENNRKIRLALGEFELIKPIGEGGNGVVYSGRIEDKIVALKFLLSDATGSRLFSKTKRFLAEYFNIILLEDLSGVVRYIDFDQLEIKDEEGEISIPIIIMKQYNSSLQKNEKICREDFERLFNFLLQTIGKIHKSGIIHRDIKPENILVDGENFVLADFGIANFHPEIFKLRADTAKKERVGNRLFSAPEQEEGGVNPMPTMDIYAIGQVLQWYVTGKTHKGTGRQKLSSINEELREFDPIIDKCLENNSQNRFQSIAEIANFIKKKRKKDIWEYIHLFHSLLVKNFPKNETGIVHTSDFKKIDRLFYAIQQKEVEFADSLWWHDGSSTSEFTLTNMGQAKWKLWDNEFLIKEIWVYHESGNYNDFILVHYIPGEPFLINGEEFFYTTIVDDTIHISYSEYQHGYAEVGDEIIDLSLHKVEFIERQKEEGFFFIGPKYNCILLPENDKHVRDLIDYLDMHPNSVDLEKIMKFQWQIRKNKHSEVIYRL